MKGIVFTEFLHMVDQHMSPEFTEKLISECALPSGGAYTTVGTYDHGEIITLVVGLSRQTAVPVPDLVKAFGHHLFDRLVELYPATVAGKTHLFDLLRVLDDEIHVGVRRLYPDAELPEIRCEERGRNCLVVHYTSKRAMGDLAEGLLAAAIRHFGHDIDMTREDVSAGTAQEVRFTLVEREGA